MSKQLSQTPSTSTLNNPTKKVKIIRVERDSQQVPVEGFRSLAVISIFIAGIESQCFSLTSGLSSDGRAVRFINGLLVVGLILSSFGAITALISARWFDLLGPNELELLDYRMKSTRERHNDSAQKSDLEANKDSELRDEVKNAVDGCKKKWRNWILARAIFVPFLLTILGFCSFVVSMITYTWKSQPVSAAAIATIASIAGFFSMFCMYLDYEAFGVISEMRFGRLRI